MKNAGPVPISQPWIYFFLTSTALLWAGNPIAVKAVLGEISPLQIVSLRFFGISLILAILLYITEGRRALPSRKTFCLLMLMGLTGIAGNNGLQFTGLKYSTAINCTLFSATNPALTAALAFIFLRETLTKRQYLGISLALFGVMFLICGGSWNTIRQLQFNSGDLLFLFSQIGWSVYSLLGRQTMTVLSPLSTTAWAGFFGALFTSLFSYFIDPSPNLNLSFTGWLSMVYMIIGSGIMAFSWWNMGVARLGPHRATIFTNLIPLAGTFLAVLLLDETITGAALVSGAFVLSGLYLTTASAA